MRTLSIIYDEIHTKDFDINGQIHTFVYDFSYSKHVQDPDLKSLNDGYYTYIIHDNHQLRVASLCEFENGSKHIQMIPGTAIQYTGGELFKKGNTIIYNLYAGLFRNINPYNLKYHNNELNALLQITFQSHNCPNIIFTDQPIINDTHFIQNGSWKLRHFNHYYT